MAVLPSQDWGGSHHFAEQDTWTAKTTLAGCAQSDHAALRGKSCARGQQLAQSLRSRVQDALRTCGCANVELGRLHWAIWRVPTKFRTSARPCLVQKDQTRSVAAAQHLVVGKHAVPDAVE